MYNSILLNYFSNRMDTLIYKFSATVYHTKVKLTVIRVCKKLELEKVEHKQRISNFTITYHTLNITNNKT